MGDIGGPGEQDNLLAVQKQWKREEAMKMVEKRFATSQNAAHYS
jgi:hypothetical protein